MGTEFLKIKECDEATEIIQKLFDEKLNQQSEEILVTESYGRILFEDVYSKMDFPPFDKALKDGFAILAEDSFGASEESPKTLDVIDFLEAGATTDKKVEKGKCIEISTGAAMPEGAESVVMVEYAEKSDGKVNLLTTATPTQDVARKGSDIEEGKLILKKGDFLNPGKIGVLLSQGFETIEVYKKPILGVISSGNEISLQGEGLTYGKIYDVNGGMIKNAAISCGADAHFLGIMRDNYDEVKHKITDALKEADIIICSGGTSAGLGDVLNSVLEELGEVYIHGISVQPGKPTIIGVIEDKLVIGLPGNPVSALMIFNAFIAEPLTKLAGIDKDFELDTVKGKMTRRIHSPVGRMQYQLVKVDGKDIHPIFKDSGAIFSLSTADGYVKVPKSVELLDEGEEVEVYLFN
ncbi:molybdopterin molybdochelatase [Methanobrevibacter gottschalkii]|uniref:Molybdopterin molybdochelatase n=2 Tax=Methanobrevibacter gottschalkii TaxID=190974 RepID=A0A3N5B4H8_9EURY|nr:MULTISPECIES: gephyrin-like molybdotransferase Glp [Methanobrevibacter]MCQ2971494.1 molybdopterin-binding protein [archaeon]OEC95028.1 molybdopterin molybdenumtransferase MoeA [Methanobrevibacter sp. A27]RPF52556.1 molybdopterin molybdochelatase [Methanobrevibacter gottschalkii DSM 11977]SEK34578.1 molybdopterin molybdochelatase [Methanobrevibacter gottschalkii]